MTWAASTLSAAIFWAKEPSEQPKSGKNRQVIWNFSAIEFDFYPRKVIEAFGEDQKLVAIKKVDKAKVKTCLPKVLGTHRNISLSIDIFKEILHYI